MTQKGLDATLDQFHEYLTSIVKVYQEIVPVLRSELDAIQEDNIVALNECLKTQQALLLKTKNFDTKINEYTIMLGISARNLSETIQKLPDMYQLSFYEVLSQFEQVSSEVKFYQEKCRFLLQSKLYLIDRALSRANIQKENITYNKDASEVQGSLFSKALEVKI